jgi:hypothetical protein
MSFPKRTKKYNAGFTLFVALVVSSMLLAVGFSLSNIIFKQLIFSNSGKESQLAFYAADSGAECALYWDRKDSSGLTVVYGAFATSTGEPEIFCGVGGSLAAGGVGSFDKVLNEGAIVNSATSTFYVDFRDPLDSTHKACAKVTVAKSLQDESGFMVEKTRIDSRGYNVNFEGTVGVGGIGTCATEGTRVVERAVILNY